MAVDKSMIIQALENAIEDHIENPDNIYESEMIKIKKDFDRIYEQLKDEANEEIDEDEENE